MVYKSRINGYVRSADKSEKDRVLLKQPNDGVISSEGHQVRCSKTRDMIFADEMMFLDIIRCSYKFKVGKSWYSCSGSEIAKNDEGMAVSCRRTKVAPKGSPSARRSRR
jgi:hypothetical protein